MKWKGQFVVTVITVGVNIMVDTEKSFATLGFDVLFWQIFVIHINLIRVFSQSDRAFHSSI